MPPRSRRPSVESLESRELPMGFSMAPPITPVPIHLVGSVVATAHLRALPIRQTMRLAGVGPLAPVGRTVVSGTLVTVGGSTRGTLTLRASANWLTLRVSGSGASLTFSATGREPASGSESAFFREAGRGTLSLGFTPGGKPGVSVVELQFS